MKRNNELPSKSKLMTDAVESLQKALDAALHQMKYAGFALTKEEVGDIYLGYNKEGNRIYVSNMGEIEIHEGWEISFEDFAKQLWEDASGESNEKELLLGLKSMVALVEKWNSEIHG